MRILAIGQRARSLRSMSTEWNGPAPTGHVPFAKWQDILTKPELCPLDPPTQLIVLFRTEALDHQATGNSPWFVNTLATSDHQWPTTPVRSSLSRKITAIRSFTNPKHIPRSAPAPIFFNARSSPLNNHLPHRTPIAELSSHSQHELIFQTVQLRCKNSANSQKGPTSNRPQSASILHDLRNNEGDASRLVPPMRIRSPIRCGHSPRCS